MKTSIFIVIIGILILCFAAVCLIGVAAYFFFVPNNGIFASPTFITPQTNIEPPAAPPPAETPAAACPTLTANIIQASQGEVYSSDSSSNTPSPDWQTLVTYRVNGDQIGDPAYESVPGSLKSQQQDAAAQRASWDLFIRIIPLEGRQMVSEYQVFTDGPNNFLAAVEQAPDDPAKWMVEVDSADLQNQNGLIFTLIHEYAHLLTLNADQVPPDIAVYKHPEDQNLYNKKAAACAAYFPGEGCSKPNSYINTFYDRFWVDIADEWQKVDAFSSADDQNRYYEKLYAFYKAHRDQFVDDYAVTNTSEDMAETFAYFILSPKPAGNSIKEQKLTFFYNYPELIQLRAQILENVCALYP
ncbi:MAG: hypothetical protein HYX49_05455 [Chloroflexi bacterium]|nr:hypothetical protein [Chloroflexota bacterium]